MYDSKNIYMEFKNIFSFWETVHGYEVKVLNEREVRAAAWLMFTAAMIAFMNAWLVWNFLFIKIIVIIFILDFTIRIFINPKYSPILILGKLIVANQEVEYVAAEPKKFAWILGLVFATIMFFLVIVQNITWPINLLLCFVCLSLLWGEALFGICIGCKIYSMIYKKNTGLCPGWACKIKIKEDIQKVHLSQFLILLIFWIIIFLSFYIINNIDYSHNTNNCVVPDWAKNIGHEEKWKLHHGCE